MLTLQKIKVLSIKQFVFWFVLFTAFLAGIALAVQASGSASKILAPGFWPVFAFLGGLTFIAYMVAFLGIKRNPQMGVMTILGSIGIKMIFSMALVLIFSLKGQGIDLRFALNFFSLYLLFSAFEMYCLLRNLRHQN